MERVVAVNGVVVYQSGLLRDAGIRHAFSTRIGGVSQGIFASLNLGNPSGCDQQDSSAGIEENYRRLLAAAGCNGMERCRVHQVHGAGVVHVRRGEAFENGVKADAILSDDPARVAAIRVADCVPVLLASADGKIVAAVHAGWRGVVAGVVTRTIEEMRRGGAGGVIAAIGPCISFDAFEVGPEVIAEFERVLGERAPVRRRDDGKGHVDLRRAIGLQLQDAGVMDVDVTDRCSYRDVDEFFSHRRERGITGRMAAIIAAHE